ncbi:MAG TPA: hypothetical protein VIU15_40710 [Streptomyces sp.]
MRCVTYHCYPDERTARISVTPDRTAMIRDRRLVLRIRVERSYGIPGKKAD